MYIQEAIIDGDVKVLPVGFGKLPTSLLNVSEVKPGYVTVLGLFIRAANTLCISIQAKRKELLNGRSAVGLNRPHSFQV